MKLFDNMKRKRQEKREAKDQRAADKEKLLTLIRAYGSNPRSHDGIKRRKAIFTRIETLIDKYL